MFTASGTRILSVERRNGPVGRLIVSYGGATHETSMRLGLTAWGRIAVRASLDGRSGVVVTLKGQTAFSRMSAKSRYGPADIVQLGNERAGKVYALDADQVTITTPLYAPAGAPAPTPTPTPRPTPTPTPTPVSAPTPTPMPIQAPDSQKVVQFGPSGTQGQFLTLVEAFEAEFADYGGEGGAVVTCDAATAETLRMLRDWGQHRKYERNVLYRSPSRLRGRFCRCPSTPRCRRST